MAFNVQYGPIGTAMGLAQQAGRAQGLRQDNAEDMDLLGYVQRAHQMANQQRATEISQSLQSQGLGIEAQRNTAQQELAKQQLAAQTEYRSGMLENKSQQVQNQGDYWQARAATGQQQADTNQQFKGGLLPVLQQKADTRVQQSDNSNANAQQANSARQQDADTRAITGEAANLQRYVDNHERNFGDPRDPGYLQVKQRLAEVQQAVQSRNQNLLGTPVKFQVQGGRGGGPPAPQQQQQPGTAPNNPVQVHSAAEYAALPPGTYYMDSTGVLAQKR